MIAQFTKIIAESQICARQCSRYRKAKVNMTKWRDEQKQGNTYQSDIDKCYKEYGKENEGKGPSLYRVIQESLSDTGHCNRDRKEVRCPAICASEQRSLHREGAAQEKLPQQDHTWYFLITRKAMQLEWSEEKIDLSEVLEMAKSSCKLF